ncbi:MAG: 16S rRNA processing protein RimM [Acidobacteriales bacterium]|nr:16S rRNA processing protein RimM [Terriglobales bacterium]
MTEYVTIARVARTQGRRGEVAADILTDFPEKFAERKRLFAQAKSGERRELQVEDHWPHKGRMVLKFAGFDSIGEAEALIGCELQLPIAERASLEAGAYFVSDLVGCRLCDGGKEIGMIESLDFSSGDAPNLKVKSGEKEYLIPFAEQYLRNVDTSSKRIEMELPSGLLDLDAPLTESEKKKQRGE